MTFMLKYKYAAYQPGIKARVVEMAINSSGIRDTARALGIGKGTVISTLKKRVRPSAGEPAVRPILRRATGGADQGRTVVVCGQ